jgi:SNF2 family DNA or RNA helicase
MLKKVKNWEENFADKGPAAGRGPGEGKRTKDDNGNLIEEVNKDFDEIANATDLLNDADLEAMDDKYSHLLSAYQMTGSAKVKGTVEFIENLVENKVKFIVFCHHYEVMDQIEDSIVKKKIPYIRIDGQIEATKRYEAVRKFQTDPNILVGILSLTASS